MNILLTNDDGVFAEGLKILSETLATRHHVTVIAPDRERSAVGHGITLHEPLRPVKVNSTSGFSGYSVDGTPVDCIRLGLSELLEEPQDMVVSGINPGENVGINIHYSGTVAAAKEASLYGVPAISVSTAGRQREHYRDAALFVRALTEMVHDRGLPFGTILNVNIPGVSLAEVSGVCVSRQSIAPVSEFFEKRVDPRNRPYYWSGPDSQTFVNHTDVDGSVLSDNYISITPIQCDTTDYGFLEDLKEWEIKTSFPTATGKV